MRKRFLGLKKTKIRQSWSKYNLYNISRYKQPPTGLRTFFQQKWTAKSETRAYHGETIRERHWQRMFRTTLRSVVPMDHRYLAYNDGSEQAEGRGSGQDLPPGRKRGVYPRTPYMNMVYAPTERRLDTAIFRALFASSTRQARQFVVHGYVKVNGKKMIYPGYQLNPGDMFQVEPERVLYATGAPKDKADRRAGRRLKAKKKESSKVTEEASESTTALQEAEPETPQDNKKVLGFLLTEAKSIINRDAISGKRKQDLRAFQRLIRRILSKSTASTTVTDSLDAQLMELTARLNISVPEATTETSEAPVEDPPATLSADDRRALRQAMIEARENPVDPSKPYATPWRPRDFMSAFAFIPRYLEVHHKICSAVYLRHPVARPGLGEVPTPFPSEMNGLAFGWYLKRR